MAQLARVEICPECLALFKAVPERDVKFGAGKAFKRCPNGHRTFVSVLANNAKSEELRKGLAGAACLPNAPVPKEGEMNGHREKE